VTDLIFADHRSRAGMNRSVISRWLMVSSTGLSIMPRIEMKGDSMRKNRPKGCFGLFAIYDAGPLRFSRDARQLCSRIAGCKIVQEWLCVITRISKAVVVCRIGCL
jgi:hypothetical protein